MKRTLLWLPALLALCAANLFAQQATNDANPLYPAPSIHIGTIVVPPVADEPFSATALIENRQIMPDGSTAVLRNVNLIGRDSRGRTHGEMRIWVPASSQAVPSLTEVLLYDPQTRTRTVCYTATHVATVLQRREPGDTPTAKISSSLKVKVEDLGPTTLDGIVVEGTRRIVTIPSQASGTGAPMTVVDEYWYSADLHLNLLLRHIDPRAGERTVALSDIKREDPDPAFFEIPEGYRIIDVTPPPSAPAKRGGAAEGSPKQ